MDPLHREYGMETSTVANQKKVQYSTNSKQSDVSIYIYMYIHSQRPVAKHYQHGGTTVNSAYSCKMCDKLRHTIKSCLIVA